MQNSGSSSGSNPGGLPILRGGEVKSQFRGADRRDYSGCVNIFYIILKHMRKPLGPRWGAKNDERRHHSCFLSNHLAEFQSKFEKSPASIMKVLGIMSIFTYLLWVAEINHDSLVFFHCATFRKTAKCFDVHLQVSAKIASEKYMRHIEEILKVAPAPFIIM